MMHFRVQRETEPEGICNDRLIQTSYTAENAPSAVPALAQVCLLPLGLSKHPA